MELGPMATGLPAEPNRNNEWIAKFDGSFHDLRRTALRAMQERDELHAEQVNALQKSVSRALNDQALEFARQREDDRQALTDVLALARIASMNCRQADVSNPELDELVDRLNTMVNPLQEKKQNG